MPEPLRQPCSICEKLGRVGATALYVHFFRKRYQGELVDVAPWRVSCKPGGGGGGGTEVQLQTPCAHLHAGHHAAAKAAAKAVRTLAIAAAPADAPQTHVPHKQDKLALCAPQVHASMREDEVKLNVTCKSAVPHLCGMQRPMLHAG